MEQLSYGLLDIRGMMLAGLLGGDDPDGPLNAEGATENTAEYGFSRFIDMSLMPVLESHSPRRQKCHDSQFVRRHLDIDFVSRQSE